MKPLDLLTDARYQPFLDRARVDCDKLFEYACPAYWGELSTTGDPAVRLCGACKELVYFVADARELADRAQRGQCVALLAPEELPPPADIAIAAARPPERIMMMGRVAYPSEFDSDSDLT